MSPFTPNPNTVKVDTDIGAAWMSPRAAYNYRLYQPVDELPDVRMLAQNDLMTNWKYKQVKRWRVWLSGLGRHINIYVHDTIDINEQYKALWQFKRLFERLHALGCSVEIDEQAGITMNDVLYTSFTMAKMARRYAHVAKTV